MPPQPSRWHLSETGATVTGAAGTGAGLLADVAAGAIPQVSQYPSSMVPGQFRWHFMTGHPSRSWR
ncbi:hypothetical protein GCM10010168_31770 [Actinoplanes ianthinogenes]|uniref:Uncharacterized protein n=1 Tax=Actinoplanes ianthinogenes TaxID=122358 RepID=A0ABM7LM33_9ACTN|nr:hypothetical protein Aiant_09750 [Actinoplanes ianthinogenes]GGR11499.1 hypothetical protein GCM10010168_31770 [Actinoplanes ianthinogenes]